MKNNVEAPNTANCVLPPEVNVPETAQVDTAISNLLLSTNIWGADVLYYLSGYIVRQVLKSIDCSDCAEALFDNTDSDQTYHTRSSLFFYKRYGNLTMPSQSVYTVVSIVDKFARKELCLWSSLSKDVVLKNTIVCASRSKEQDLHFLGAAFNRKPCSRKSSSR